MTSWFIADLHLGHKLVSELRGFPDTEAHDAAVLDSITRTVNPTDLLWVLGDVTCTSNKAWIKNALDLLTNTCAAAGIYDTRLVSGNHDPVWPGHRESFRWNGVYQRHFHWVTPFARLRLSGHRVVLSHFPYQYGGDHTVEDRYAQYRLPDLGDTLVHGHTHSRERIARGPAGGLQICVCWEAWQRPVSDQEIIALIEQQEQGQNEQAG